MTITYKDEVSEQLPASSTLIYTAGTLKSAHIIYATAYNTGANPESIMLNVVQSGGSVADSNIYALRNVPAGGSLVISELLNRILKTGDAIYAEAGTVDSINLSIGIKEVS